MLKEWIVAIATIIICLVLPFVVNLCKNQEWSSNTKRWIAISFSAIAGVATGCISGIPTAETFVTWIMAVVGGTQLAYSAFKSIGITSNWLDSLEGIGMTSKNKNE